MRLNDDELEIIKGSARLLNKTVSDFIRFSVSCYIQNNLNVDRSSIRESHVVAKKKSQITGRKKIAKALHSNLQKLAIISIRLPVQFTLATKSENQSTYFELTYLSKTI